MPGAEEVLWFNKPAVFMHGQFLTKVHDKEEAMTFRVSSMEMRDMMLEAEPKLFYITDHYRNFPFVLARLSALTPHRVEGTDRRPRRAIGGNEGQSRQAEETAAEGWGEEEDRAEEGEEELGWGPAPFFKIFVIPAKAGIQLRLAPLPGEKLDARFRGHDSFNEARYYRGLRFARIRCKVRRCMFSRRAVSDTLCPHNS